MADNTSYETQTELVPTKRDFMADPRATVWNKALWDLYMLDIIGMDMWRYDRNWGSAMYLTDAGDNNIGRDWTDWPRPYNAVAGEDWRHEVAKRLLHRQARETHVELTITVKSWKHIQSLSNNLILWRICVFLYKTNDFVFMKCIQRQQSSAQRKMQKNISKILHSC